MVPSLRGMTLLPDPPLGDAIEGKREKVRKRERERQRERERERQRERERERERVSE